MNMIPSSTKRVLILEAFYGGSHKDLIDYIQCILGEEKVEVDLVTMSDKKWHWRMRTSGLYFSQKIPRGVVYSVVFATCVINFAELLGLRPELNSAHKIIYFHENQLVYPVRKQKDRDFQYGYNQILSCLSADTVLFNSNYNMTSFLSNIHSYFNVLPDYRPETLEDTIAPKCSVLYYALDLRDSGCEKVPKRIKVPDKEGPLHIIWAHRWEHDKNPDDFFDIMFQLLDDGVQFFVSILGQSFTLNPEIFAIAQEKLKDHIIHWGYIDSKDEYIKLLNEADVAVSTANHEFFGVSMLEAVSYGCYPLCPNRLVYPEIFPRDYLYNTNQQLLKKIRYFSKNPHVPRKHEVAVDLARFDGKNLKSEYLEYLLR